MSQRVETFGNGVTLHCGDCALILPTLPDNSVDSVVTDPPYHLTSIVKRFAQTSQGDATKTSDRARRGADGMARLSRGFMGKSWDGGDIAFRPEIWAQVLRVLKPGGHVLAFGGTRTYHRMVCAIEDAGFEVRDQIAWLYGSGFPKSHNQKGEWSGWGTALKPAIEPIVLARKPLAGTVAQNVLAYGTGAINVDGCRIPAEDQESLAANWDREKHTDIRGGKFIGGTPSGITLNSKPGNGRWPANVVHDGSDEVVESFPESESQRAVVTSTPGSINGAGSGLLSHTGEYGFNDAGSAARFFYTAKADADDRIGSKHPTVKPVDLIQYLVRLITPPKGTVLDLFAGTGTTGEAAFREGFKAILIEAEAEYQADIKRRMALSLAGPDERRRESLKARGAVSGPGPLFGDDSETRGGRKIYGVFADERSARSD